MKISIIVPVYNVQAYLPNLMDSLTGQTLDQIEILAVNDGSTDESARILEAYQKQYANLHVFTTENCGVSHARNYAIDRAEGEYLLFVDSDDWIDPDMCRLLYEKAAADSNDIVLCGRYDVFEGASGKPERVVPVKVDIAAQNFALSEHKEALTHISAYPWDKLFRRSLFAALRFPHGLRFEDLALVFEILHDARSIGVVNQPLYHYRRTSQTGFLNHISESTLDIVKAFTLLYDAMRRRGLLSAWQDELEFLCVKHFFMRYIACLSLYKKGGLPIKLRIIRETHAFLARQNPAWRNNPYLPGTLSLALQKKLPLFQNEPLFLAAVVLRNPFLAAAARRKR